MQKSKQGVVKKQSQIKCQAFCLGDSDRQEVLALGIFSTDDQEKKFSALEHLMNIESWLDWVPGSTIKRERKTARIARDYQKLSKSLTSLGAVLKTLDPVVLNALNDTFSFIQFDKISNQSDRNSAVRVVLPVDELLSKTQRWAAHTSKKLSEEMGKSYYFRFLDELADFWFEEISESGAIPNAKFRRLAKILLRPLQKDSCAAFDDSCKKQIDRWSKAKKLSKGQVKK